MKDLAFSLLRAVFRFLFFLPRGVRQSWRTLLVWSRRSWVCNSLGISSLGGQGDEEVSKGAWGIEG